MTSAYLDSDSDSELRLESDGSDTELPVCTIRSPSRLLTTGTAEAQLGTTAQNPYKVSYSGHVVFKCDC